MDDGSTKSKEGQDFQTDIPGIRSLDRVLKKKIDNIIRKAKLIIFCLNYTMQSSF